MTPPSSRPTLAVMLENVSRKPSPSDRARVAPLMLATMASQALIVVLAPTIVAIGADLDASVGSVGQARAIAAGAAILAAAAIARRIDHVAIPRLIALGAALAVVGSGTIAAAPTLPVFLLAHVLIGIAVASLLSAGFAGVTVFARDRRAWAIGRVAGANALAWIVVTPVVGIVTERISWRAAEALPAAIALAAMLTARTASSAPGPPETARIRTLFSHRSARRWIGAELTAYGAWTALLTFVGAFFVERLAVREGVAGWLLAAGAAAYFLASTRRPAITDAIPRRRLVAGVSLLMAILFVAQLNVGAPALATAVFCLLGLAAGVRTPVSSGLGLDQLPDRPGAMMAARTAVTQAGYLLGAVTGGLVLEAGSWPALGVALAACMAASAWAISRVSDPLDDAIVYRAPRDERAPDLITETRFRGRARWLTPLSRRPARRRIGRVPLRGV